MSLLFHLVQPENPFVCSVNPDLNYQIFATMFSFYIPLIAVLIIYANIYRTAQTAMDTRSSVQMSQFMSPNNSSSTNFSSTPSAHMLSQQQLNGNSISTPQLYLNASNSNKIYDNLSTSHKRLTVKVAVHVVMNVIDRQYVHEQVHTARKHRVCFLQLDV